jgi:hypothetical protein
MCVIIEYCTTKSIRRVSCSGNQPHVRNRGWRRRTAILRCKGSLCVGCHYILIIERHADAWGTGLGAVLIIVDLLPAAALVSVTQCLLHGWWNSVQRDWKSIRARGNICDRRLFVGLCTA